MGGNGETLGKMGKTTGKMSHNACNFTSFQHVSARLPLFCLWLTKLTPSRVCIMSPSRPEPRSKIGVRVCKIFATFLHQLPFFSPGFPIFPHSPQFPPFFLPEREVERVTEVPPLCGESGALLSLTHSVCSVPQDVRIWGDSGLLGIFRVLGPFVTVWPLEQTALYVRLSAIFSRYLRTRSTNYIYDLEEYVKDVVAVRREVVLTGVGRGVCARFTGCVANTVHPWHWHCAPHHCEPPSQCSPDIVSSHHRQVHPPALCTPITVHVHLHPFACAPLSLCTCTVIGVHMQPRHCTVPISVHHHNIPCPS